MGLIGDSSGLAECVMSALLSDVIGARFRKLIEGGLNE